MDGILDLSKELDVSLLDRVVLAFYTGAGAEQALAQQVLTQFQDHPDAWQNVPLILQTSNEVQSKFLALNIMANLVSTRWKVLPSEQTQGIRNFIIGVILQHSQNEEILRQSKTYLAKLNITLVEILKQEWPNNWPDFIPEIVASSRTSEALCENNMVILKLLFEEIFDAGDQMTQEKSKALQSSLHAQFSQVFDLCLEVLEKSHSFPLIYATLETVVRFLWWIGPDYVYNTQLIDLLLTKYLDDPKMRKITLKCLLEISRLPAGVQYKTQIINIFNTTVGSMRRVLLPDASMREIYASSNDYDQQIIFQFALFLATFLSKHHKLVETSEAMEQLKAAHAYLLHFARINEREIFKICLEYWHILITGLYIDVALQRPAEDISSALNGLQVDDNKGQGEKAANTKSGNRSGRSEVWKTLYLTFLSELREVIVDRMVKPAEVLIVQTEDGEIVRERLRESESIAVYKATREILIYLTHLDMKDMLKILNNRLSSVMFGNEWSRSRLNSLCWAIGAISGTMREDVERQFMVDVVKNLLVLCDSKTDKDDRAIVASNLTYVVGQYPRFLKSNWKFLKIFINKLFEFMNDSHEGVREMACDTFMKIAYKRRRDFILVQPDETEAFVYTIIQGLPTTTASISTSHAQIVYESVGHMIFAQANLDARIDLVNTLMQRPNQQWRGLVDGPHPGGLAVLDFEDLTDQVIRILRINASVCSAVGEAFIFEQLNSLFNDVLELYKESSRRIRAAVATSGDIAAVTPGVRYLRKLRKAIINLVETCVRRADGVASILDTCIPSVFDTISPLYAQDPLVVREPDVLGPLTMLFSKVGPLVRPRVDEVYTNILVPTLAMIALDFSSYLEHRLGFYKLLRAINRGTFNGFLDMQLDHLSVVMDSVIWGMKHTTRDISDLALTFCLELFNNSAQYEENAAQDFLKSFFVKVLDEVFFVMTDSNHRCSFTFQSALIGRMFHILQTNRIRVPLGEAPAALDNRAFVVDHCLRLLTTAFPHTSSHNTELFLMSVCEHHSNLAKIKTICRDFVIQLKEFSGDNSELFVEESGNKTQHDELELVGLVQGTRLQEDDED